MKRSLLFFIVVLALAGLLAAGCTPPRAEAMLQATPTAPGEAPADEAASPGDAAPTSAPAEEMPTALPSSLSAPDTACIDCHSDAELLQVLAEEPEVVEAPSEGSG